MSRAFAFLAVLCAIAQSSGQTPVAARDAIIADHTVARSMKRAVGFLKLNCAGGLETRGTAFFVAYQDEKAAAPFIYLVTNRHVAEPVSDRGQLLRVDSVTLRLNLRAPHEGTASEEISLNAHGNMQWAFPEDDAVDLAAIPITLDQRRYDFVAFSVSDFLTKDRLVADDVSEGDKVLFAGFFTRFPGQYRIEPIVREGIVALFPEEKMMTTRRKMGDVYLADVHTLLGNSGSPAFVNIGGVRHARYYSWDIYRLLGVVSGYFYEDEKLNMKVATTLTGTGLANSGISIIVPAEKIKELLDLPMLKVVRDAAWADHATGAR